MKPIVTLGILAIAATGLGYGFLGNTIDLSMVQSLGVGETDLTSDVDKANVDFTIDKVAAIGNNNVQAFKNIISECIIQNYDPNQGQVIPFIDDSTVICKLTDINDNVVAEGSATTSGGQSVITVPIPNQAGLPNQVQNVHDIIVVVQGPQQVQP